MPPSTKPLSPRQVAEKYGMPIATQKWWRNNRSLVAGVDYDIVDTAIIFYPKKLKKNTKFQEYIKEKDTQ